MVAISAGAIIPAGLTLPYWLRYAIIFTGISCSEEIFITRKVHISLLAVLLSGMFCMYPGLFRCDSRSARFSIARSPAGVAAHPRPRMFATKFVDIDVSEGCPLGIFGKRKRITGASILVILSIMPALMAISIRPFQKDTIPSIVMLRVMASFDEEITASVTACILPVKEPYKIPIKSIPPQR